MVCLLVGVPRGPVLGPVLLLRNPKDRDYRVALRLNIALNDFLKWIRIRD